jgi:uncharacterized protein (DUF983 family)
MNGSLRDGNPTKNGKGASFNIFVKATPADQRCDLSVIASMDMMSGWAMVIVMMISLAVMVMAVPVMVMISRSSLVPVMATCQKAPTCYAISLSALETAGRQIDGQGLQGLLKNILGNPEIPECRNGHVAADSGKGIYMKEFHDGESLAVEGILPIHHSHLLSWETAIQKN